MLSYPLFYAFTVNLIRPKPHSKKTHSKQSNRLVLKAVILIILLCGSKVESLKINPAAQLNATSLL
jgi:hypothetical protein